VPIRVTVKSNKNPYAEGEEKAGQGSARAPFGLPEGGLPSSGLKAKTRIAAAAKAKAGADGKPQRPTKKFPPKPKVGNPRGRAAKLARPGVKPKRASRPPSTGRRPR
jgi:GTP-binding protein